MEKLPDNDRTILSAHYECELPLAQVSVRVGRSVGALKQVLLRAYFTDGLDVSDAVELARLAGEVGLDAQRAAAILVSDEFATDVRKREQNFLAMGVNSVPAIIINQQHLISGGQPVEVFEQALRQIAAIA